MNDYAVQAGRFKAFCDENRLKIIEILQGGEKCACELLELLSMGQSTLSYHMKILCESGIVENRQEGKWAHYRISSQGSTEAITYLQTLTTPKEDTASCSDNCACGDK